MRDTRLAWVALVVVVAACGEPAPGPDGGGTCTTSAQCSDDVFCNGAESCEPDADDADARGCVAAASSPCTGACDEEADSCASCDRENPDQDGDGSDSIACGGGDCDDANAAVAPGLVEVCDLANADEDCDLDTFGARDQDADGQVDAQCCNGTSSGAMRCGDDCDDTIAAVRAGLAETCDALDNDCDGLTDEEVGRMFYPDVDGDTFGDRESAPISGCTAPAGTAENNTDCDDSDPGRSPRAVEVCDGRDNDCNDALDGPDEDDDGDGFADASCAGAAGTDCRDDDPLAYPGADERCNGLDDDCADGGGAQAGEDDDGDGVSPLGASCVGGFATDDCDDGADGAASYPGAPELCDGRDNDCNGMLDEEPFATASCRLPNATSVCGSTGCAITSCDPGYLDCDSGAGCESDPMTAAAHCGGCGYACGPEGVCREGYCDTLDIVAGAGYSCATQPAAAGREPGTVVCWGAEYLGGLGTDATSDQLTPQVVPGIDHIVQLSSSVGYPESYYGAVCALRDDGALFCWGSGNWPGRSGRLPQRVALTGDAAHANIFDSYFCAARTDGTTTCSPTTSATRVESRSRCAIRSTGEVSCPYGAGSTFVAMPGVTDAVSFAGGHETNVVRRNGHVTVWRTSPSVTTFDIAGADDVVAASVASLSMCFLRRNGTVACRYNPSNPFVDVPGITDAIAVSLGYDHACVRLRSGGVRCWGDNAWGELGDGTRVSSATPVTVVGFP